MKRLIILNKFCIYLLAINFFSPFNLIMGENTETSKALEQIFKDQKIYFIQIGSNNGVTGDPIFRLVKKYGWSGVLVEPVPYLFEELKINYKNISRIFFENSAISEARGILDFYSIDTESDWYKSNAPKYVDLLGSFYPDHIYNHLKTDVPVVKLQIPCITFQDLVEKNQLTSVDLLHIDTEGYDSSIILSIDFKLIKPRVILFEHAHAYRDFNKFDECIEYLKSNNYKLLLKSHADMLWVSLD